MLETIPSRLDTQQTREWWMIPLYPVVDDDRDRRRGELAKAGVAFCWHCLTPLVDGSLTLEVLNADGSPEDPSDGPLDYCSWACVAENAVGVCDLMPGWLYVHD